MKHKSGSKKEQNILLKVVLTFIVCMFILMSFASAQWDSLIENNITYNGEEAVLNGYDSYFDSVFPYANDSLNFNSGVTFLVNATIRSTTQSQNPALMYLTDIGDSIPRLYFTIDRNNANRLTIEYRKDGFGAVATKSPANESGRITLNQEQRLGFTLNQSDGSVTIYIDGYDTQNSAFSQQANINFNNADVRVGFGGTPSDYIINGNLLQGNISHIKLYNRSLTPSEISDEFNGVDIQEGLIAYYPLTANANNTYEPPIPPLPPTNANITSNIRNYIEFHNFTQNTSNQFIGEIGNVPLSVSGTLSSSNGVVNINNANLTTYNVSSLSTQANTIGFWLNATAQNNFYVSGDVPFEDSGTRSSIQSRSTYLLFNKVGGTVLFNPSLNYSGFNEWNHIVMSFNGSHETAYINGDIAYDIGIADKYEDVVSTYNSLLYGTNEESRIRFNDINENEDMYIKEFFIYNDSMSIQEVNNVMNFGAEVLSFIPPSNVVISEPSTSHTLNSSGKDIYFEYTHASSIPPAYYNVSLNNSVIDYNMKLETPLNNFTVNLDKTDIPITDNYSVKVIAYNSEGTSLSTSNYKINICINNWVLNSNACVNDTRLISYYDSSSCSESYELPADNGTFEVCDDNLVSDEELNASEKEFNEQLLFLLIFALALGGGLLISYSANNIIVDVFSIIVMISAVLLTLSNALEEYKIIYIFVGCAFIMGVAIRGFLVKE